MFIIGFAWIEQYILISKGGIITYGESEIAKKKDAHKKLLKSIIHNLNATKEIKTLLKKIVGIDPSGEFMLNFIKNNKYSKTVILYIFNRQSQPLLCQHWKIALIN